MQIGSGTHHAWAIVGATRRPRLAFDRGPEGGLYVGLGDRFDDDRRLVRAVDTTVLRRPATADRRVAADSFPMLVDEVGS